MDQTVTLCHSFEMQDKIDSKGKYSKSNTLARFVKERCLTSNPYSEKKC